MLVQRYSKLKLVSGFQFGSERGHLLFQLCVTVEPDSLSYFGKKQIWQQITQLGCRWMLKTLETLPTSWGAGNPLAHICSYLSDKPCPQFARFLIKKCQTTTPRESLTFTDLGYIWSKSYTCCINSKTLKSISLSQKDKYLFSW